MSDPYLTDGPPTVPTSPNATGVYTDTSLTYAASIDAVTGLYTRVTYDNGCAAAGVLPILVLMHGYTGDANSFTPTDRQRYASYGFIVITPGLRAKNSATGTTDANGRETMDIADAVAAVRAAYPAVASPTVATIAGYSGGGANAIHCMVKLPELFAHVALFFPVWDYGLYSTGWYTYQPAQAPALLDVDIGVPSTHEAEYRTRYSPDALALMMVNAGTSCPYVYLFNDSGDAVLNPATHTAAIASLVAAGVSTTHYQWHPTTVGDTWRAKHGYPLDNAEIIQGEYYYARRLRDAAAWTMPTSGSVQVLGWIKFGTTEIWLGDASSPRTTGGKNRTARLVYNTSAGTYRLTPELGVTHCYVKQGASVAHAFSSSRTVIVAPSSGTVSQINNDLDHAPITGWSSHAVRATRTAPTRPAVIAAAKATTWHPADHRSRTAL